MSDQVIVMNGVPGVFAGFADGGFKPAIPPSIRDEARRSPGGAMENRLHRACRCFKGGLVVQALALVIEARMIGEIASNGRNGHKHRI